MVDAARRAPGERPVFDVFAHQRHQIAYRLDGRIRLDHHDQIVAGEARQRLHLAEVHRRPLQGHGSYHHRPPDQQGVGVLVVLLHKGRQAQRAAFAAQVFIIDLLAQARSHQGGPQGAAGLVPAAVFVGGNDDAHARGQGLGGQLFPRGQGLGVQHGREPGEHTPEAGKKSAAAQVSSVHRGFQWKA